MRRGIFRARLAAIATQIVVAALTYRPLTTRQKIAINGKARACRGDKYSEVEKRLDHQDQRPALRNHTPERRDLYEPNLP